MEPPTRRHTQLWYSIKKQTSKFYYILFGCVISGANCTASSSPETPVAVTWLSVRILIDPINKIKASSSFKYYNGIPRKSTTLDSLEFRHTVCAWHKVTGHFPNMMFPKQNFPPTCLMNWFDNGLQKNSIGDGSLWGLLQKLQQKFNKLCYTAPSSEVQLCRCVRACVCAAFPITGWVVNRQKDNNNIDRAKTARTECSNFIWYRNLPELVPTTMHLKP